MRKLLVPLTIAATLVFATGAQASIITSRNGVGTTYAYCHAYNNYIGMNVKMTDENDFLVQPVGFDLRVQRWNGSAWALYSHRLVDLPDGGSAYYPYAFNVAGGYYYRVDVFYVWDRQPNADATGEETLRSYTQYGNTLRTRNAHAMRSGYCAI